MKLNALALCAAFALTLAGCTTSKQGSAGKEDLSRAARSIFGTELVGARGATARDQDKIDDTVTGACAVGAYTPAECRRHQQETSG